MKKKLLFNGIETDDYNNQLIKNFFDQPPSLSNYLCHWSKKYKYVYMETPKVACTTIKRVLQQAEVGGGITYDAPSIVHDRGRSPLLSPQSNVAEFVSIMNDASYFKFCFVRNPFTRVLSCYLDKMVKNTYERKRLAPKLGLNTTRPPAFLEFLAAVSDQDEYEHDIHWATQTYLLRPNRLQYSFVGRFELFRGQFGILCERLGVLSYADDLSDSWHATNAWSKVKDYIGKEEIRFIHKIYEKDFRNFGYGWSPEVI